MTSRSEDAERLANTRAQVHTDSLTLTLDLKRLRPCVAEAFCRVLRVPVNPSGFSMPAQDPSSFQEAVRFAFRELERGSQLDALEFATILSALLHECRHVHDMRATRCGAELLLHDLRVYAGVSSLLDRLAEWGENSGSRPVPLPVTAGLDRFGGAARDILERITLADQRRNRVDRWWTARSRGPTLPGHSIRSLFEALGYSVQIEWLASTFGGEVADRVLDATVGPGATVEKYLRPAMVLAALTSARGVLPDPEPHDMSWLLVHALSASGIDQAFADGSPTDQHPGTWFDLFAQRYAALSTRNDLPAALVAPYAVELATEAAGIGGMDERFAAAAEAIQALQLETLRTLGGRDSEEAARQAESILIATEVAVDFRAMQSIIAEKPEYHLPMGYAGMLIGGELTTVHVRVHNSDGTLGDFRTPSDIPANHVGGARAASEASQRMRLLLRGRNVGSGTFFEEAVYRQLKAPPPDGWGLTFRAAG